MAEPLFVDSKGREVALPEGAWPVADTHAHLDMLDDPAGALARAAMAGVGFVATVADPSEDAFRTYDELPGWLQGARDVLAEAGRPDAQLPEVRVVVGVHPHNAKEYDPQVEVELRRLLDDGLSAALGEIGLDYHYDYSPRDVQREVFRRQLSIACDRDVPAVIHLREAHDDGEAILREEGLPSSGCVLHCYNLGPELLGRFLALGCHVSFAGPLTFKKADEVRTAAALVPLDRVLTETDCPFMAPEPFRGRKNEPAMVVFTAARLAGIRSDGGDVFSAAYDNAVRLFAARR